MAPRTSRRLARLSVVCALVLVAGACGDDDDEEDAGSASPSTTAAEQPDDEGDNEGGGAAAGDAAAYCDALVEFNSAVFEVQLEDGATEEDILAAGEQLTPLFDEVEANAPEEVAATAAELGTTIDSLNEGDATAFNAEETSSTYFTMVADSLETCGLDPVEITAVDYAFEGVPDTIPAGQSGLVLVNDSDAGEPHEFIIFKKAEGDTRSAEEILNDPASQEQGPGEFAGAAFAATPGTRAGAILDLEPGNYIAVCFIPVGGGEEGPPHFTEGMVAEFTVS